ncbi:MAG: PrsW family glutamic-type intramembrane protease [Nitrososphaeria archaeon]
MSELQESHILIKLHHPDIYEKIFFFLSGIIISVPLTLFVEIFGSQNFLEIPGFFFTLFSVAILPPLIEEFAKAYPIFYRHGETERSIFILGFLSGLGFGVTEFFFYVVNGAPIYIRIFGVFFHAANTSIIAYGVAKKQVLKFYSLAVFLHALNNFSALLGIFYLVGGSAALATSFSFSYYFYTITKEKIYG